VSLPIGEGGRAKDRSHLVIFVKVSLSTVQSLVRLFQELLTLRPDLLDLELTALALLLSRPLDRSLHSLLDTSHLLLQLVDQLTVGSKLIELESERSDPGLGLEHGLHVLLGQVTELFGVLLLQVQDAGVVGRLLCLQGVPRAKIGSLSSVSQLLLIGATAVGKTLGEHLQEALEVAVEFLSGRSNDEKLSRGMPLRVRGEGCVDCAALERLDELQQSLWVSQRQRERGRGKRVMNLRVDPTR
jgi:hypothetical protein